MANFWGAAEKKLAPGAQMGMQFFRWGIEERRHEAQQKEKEEQRKQALTLGFVKAIMGLAGKEGGHKFIPILRAIAERQGIDLPEIPRIPAEEKPGIEWKEGIGPTAMEQIPVVGEIFKRAKVPQRWEFPEMPEGLRKAMYYRGAAAEAGVPPEKIEERFPEEPEKYKRGAMAQEAYDLALAELESKDHPQFNTVYRNYLNKIFKAKQAQREKSLVQIKIGKPAPSQERENLNKLFEFRIKLSRIENLFDPAFVGRFEGGISGATREFLGVSITKKEVMFRQVVKDIADTLLRLRSGAQINEQEYKRLSKLVPTVGLPDEVFLARLQSLAKSIDESIGIRQRTLKESGFVAPSASTIDVQQMSDDELLQIIGE